MSWVHLKAMTPCVQYWPVAGNEFSLNYILYIYISECFFFWTHHTHWNCHYIFWGAYGDGSGVWNSVYFHFRLAPGLRCLCVYMDHTGKYASNCESIFRMFRIEQILSISLQIVYRTQVPSSSSSLYTTIYTNIYLYVHKHIYVDQLGEWVIDNSMHSKTTNVFFCFQIYIYS